MKHALVLLATGGAAAVCSAVPSLPRPAATASDARRAVASVDVRCETISPAAFRAPPSWARPHTWWHWMNGNVTTNGITADLEAMAAAGIGGAQIFDAGLALPRGPVAFASDAWFDCLAHADREARRLGLELCLANCSGWTSSAGPWIPPDLSMKYVTNTAVRVKGGARFAGRLPVPDKTHGFYEDIAVLAFPEPVTFVPPLRALPDFDSQTFRIRGGTKLGAQEGGPTFPRTITSADAPPQLCLAPGDILDLTARLRPDGTLDWTAPATHPDWLILRFGFMANGRTNRSATKEGYGLECDKLDPHALDVHFDAYVGRALKRLGPDRALTGVLLDSYEVFGQNWTRGFDRAFAAQAGYSVTNFLPVLAGWPVASAAATDRFLRDFRKVIARLFATNYAGRLRERCHENGLRFYCEPYGNGPFNDLEYARESDVPMAEFWRPRDAGADLAALARAGGGGYMICRWGSKPLGNGATVASTAHVWGMPVVGAEAFTSYPDAGSGRWAETPFAIKAQCDRVFSEGVNQMIFHRFVHQPWTAPLRAPGMTMAAYGAHFDRTQTWWNHGAREFFGYMTRAQYLLRAGRPVGDVLLCASGEAPAYGTEGEIPRGYGGDRCHPDALEKCTADADGVTTPGGVRYRVVGAPKGTPGAARLAAAGATVVPYGEVAAALARRGVAPDFTCSDRDATWLHRRAGGTDIYFVAVPNKTRTTVRCTFRDGGARAPELWDPVTGETRRTAFTRTDDRTEIDLDCPPSHSVFVVFPARATEGGMAFSVRDAAPDETAAPVAGPWRVTFRELGASADIAADTFAVLASWTTHANPDIRFFAGTATYTATAPCPPRPAGGRIVLDLGRVKEIAEVTVNGRAYPALWAPPFRVDVTDAVTPGAPVRLEIRVTNLWPNRLIGDAALPEDCDWDDGSQSKGCPLVRRWPDWLVRGEPSPTGRHAFTTCRFWTADDPLLESGLLGPVALCTVPSPSSR